MKITEKTVPSPLMSSKGGHKVGTRHKVAGSRNHHKFLYRTLVYSSGREAKIMFFLEAQKEGEIFFCVFSTHQSPARGLGTDRVLANRLKRLLCVITRVGTKKPLRAVPTLLMTQNRRETRAASILSFVRGLGRPRRPIL